MHIMSSITIVELVYGSVDAHIYPMKVTRNLNQWRIQDFPQEGAPTPKSAIIFQFFYRRLHENERILDRGGASLAPPLGSANVNY